MSDARPPVPRALAREVKVEAGYRCAIPTCRETSGLEIHHIESWAKVREHTFDNLILLCAVCHARATKREIDTTAVRQFKANLGLLNGRYGDLERRLLERWAREGAGEGARVVFPGGVELLFSEIVRDGVVTESRSSMRTAADVFGPVMSSPAPDGREVIRSGTLVIPMQIGFTLTAPGAELVDRIRRALPVDEGFGEAQTQPER